MLTLNLRAIAEAHAAAVHRLLRLLVCLIAYSINIHTYFNGSCMRKFQKEKNYYKNNRGSFWELENRIMGRKKRIMCGCLVEIPGNEYAIPLSQHPFRPLTVSVRNQNPSCSNGAEPRSPLLIDFHQPPANSKVHPLVRDP